MTDHHRDSAHAAEFPEGIKFSAVNRQAPGYRDMVERLARDGDPMLEDEERPAEKLVLVLSVDTEKLQHELRGVELRLAQHEIDRLRARVDGLLQANNREVERRRKGEGLLRGAAKLFRSYEAHHEAKVVGLIGLERDAVKDKIIRNAVAADEIETFLAGAAA